MMREPTKLDDDDTEEEEAENGQRRCDAIQDVCLQSPEDHAAATDGSDDSTNTVLRSAQNLHQLRSNHSNLLSSQSGWLHNGKSCMHCTGNDSAESLDPSHVSKSGV